MSNAAFVAVPGALPLSVQDWHALASSPGYREDLLGIVVDRQGPAAFIRCELDAGTGEIDAVGVAPRRCGQGLGRWLLLWGQARLASHGVTRFRIFVAESNTPAHELYLSEGYAVIETRESWERTL